MAVRLPLLLLSVVHCFSSSFSCSLSFHSNGISDVNTFNRMASFLIQRRLAKEDCQMISMEKDGKGKIKEKRSPWREGWGILCSFILLLFFGKITFKWQITFNFDYITFRWSLQLKWKAGQTPKCHPKFGGKFFRISQVKKNGFLGKNRWATRTRKRASIAMSQHLVFRNWHP